MNMKKIEIKVLAFATLLFWIFQLLGEEREWMYLLILTGIAVVLMALKTKLKINNLALYTILFQIVALYLLRLFRITKQSTIFDDNANRNIVLEVALILIALCIVYIFARKKNNFITKRKINLVYVVMAIGFLIRELNCYTTGYVALQNDVGIFEEGANGHMGYIYAFFKHFTFPKGDPRDFCQYYHPPLHHSVSAMWAKLNSWLGVPEDLLPEMIQVLALFYSMMVIIVGYKIMKEITKNKKALLIGVVLVTFFPYAIEYAGAVNNDQLCLVLSLMAILYFIRWYKKSSYKNIILCAVCLGCGMMTKMSASVLAPPMAVMFIFKLIKDRKNILNYIKQYLCFGAISIPLGLWYPIRNLILYGMPLNYVLRLPKDSVYDLEGKFTVTQRLFGFSWDQFNALQIDWAQDAKDYVSNIWISLSKYAVYGESDYFAKDKYTGIVGTWMYRAMIILIVLVIVGFVAWFFKYKMNREIKAYLALTVIVGILSYLYFQFEYPGTPTLSIRYMMTTVVLLLGIAGVSANCLNKLKSKDIWMRAIEVFLAVYVVVNTVGTLSLLFRA